MSHKIDCVSRNQGETNIDCEVRNQGETKMIVKNLRIAINVKQIDREDHNQGETKLIARFARGNKIDNATKGIPN
jgi:hypothetical protein